MKTETDGRDRNDPWDEAIAAGFKDQPASGWGGAALLVFSAILIAQGEYSDGLLLLPWGLFFILSTVRTGVLWQEPEFRQVDFGNEPMRALVVGGYDANPWADIAKAICFLTIGLGFIIFPPEEVSASLGLVLGVLALAIWGWWLYTVLRGLDQLNGWAFSKRGITSLRDGVVESIGWEYVEEARSYSRISPVPGSSVKFPFFGTKVSDPGQIERTARAARFSRFDGRRSEGVDIFGAAPETAEGGGLLDEVAQRAISDSRFRSRLASSESVEELLARS